MEGIYETNSTFAFDKLVLTPPTVVSGGNHFIKYLINGSPLYIQPPKCKTKGGILKSGKKIHCDLMFTNENEEFIRWIENLEAHTCKYIYENREKWFETEMEMADIENYLASPLKLYKSGKFYLARTNINTRLGKMSLKIYDENEQDVDPDTIGEKSQIITILEIQGIKCSARSFQIEIEVKQMMVLRPSDLFEKCILTKSKPVNETMSENVKLVDVVTSALIETIQNDDMVVEDVEDDMSNDDNDISKTQDDKTEETHSNLENVENAILDSIFLEEPPPIDLAEFEIKFDVDKLPETETVQIKARNDVYYEMYKEARKKAKLARDMALNAYLDAKQIKQTYLLNDVDDSESDNGDDEYFSRLSQDTK